MSVAPEVAAVALAQAGKNPCKKLKESNEEDRKRLSEDKDLKGSKAGKTRTSATDLGKGRTRTTGKGAEVRVGHRNTITNAVHTGGGATTHMKACSKKLAQKFDNGFEQGLSTKDVNAKTSNMADCSPGFDYPTTSRQNPKQSHTEARLIEKIMSDKSNRGGKLTMKIDWAGEEQDDNGDWQKTNQDVPCAHCEKVICAAKECGLVVELCKDGEPVEPECEDGQFAE